MTVRNESAVIERCLDSAAPWVDQILIADTGSSDHTVDLIRDKHKATIFHISLQRSRCLTLSDARNYLIQKATSEWILTLDADEILSVHSEKGLGVLLLNSENVGYFGNWVNNPWSRNKFVDYKLFLFRREIQMQGLVHSSATPTIREQGLKAEWQNSFEVFHSDPEGANKDKQYLRRRRLLCALSKEPAWTRYHWFLGYSYFCEGQKVLAQKYLSQAYYAQSDLFPIETMCSGAVLACLQYAGGRICDAKIIIEQLLELIAEKQYDFEMPVNQRVVDWILDSERLLKRGKLAIDELPRFAY